MLNAFRCVSLMGRGDGSCGGNWLFGPTGHDNTDVYDVFRHNAREVGNNYIKRVSANEFNVAWEEEPLTAPNLKEHSETNFLIYRSNLLDSGFTDVFSSSSRNSTEMDGRDHLGNLVGPSVITVNDGEQWCFRGTPETFAFAEARAEHEGWQSSSDCITRSSDGLDMIATSYRTNDLFIKVYNEGNAAITDVAVTLLFSTDILCTASIINPGDFLQCTRDGPECAANTLTIIWAYVVSYIGPSGPQTVTIGYDCNDRHTS